MRRVRNVIFDLDGTLVDSVPGIQWSVEAALGSPCRDLRPLIGPPIRDILATVSGASDPAVLDRMEAAFRRSYDSDGWRRTAAQAGVVPVLESLRAAGCDLWLVTNKPALATRAIMGGLELQVFFRELVSRDSRQPPFCSKEQMLANLMQRHALDPVRSIMVGDTLEDCRAAAAVGIACAVVPHGYGTGLDGLLPEGSRRIAGWNDLLDWR